MIAFLAGTVKALLPKSIILLAGEVGYEVFLPATLKASLREGESVSYFIATVVKAESMELYGFENLEARALFLRLLQISGLGPKSAISLLEIPLDTFFEAVKEGNIKPFLAVPGIGKKMAQKIILELQGTLPEDIAMESQILSEVVEALKTFGYKEAEIRAVLKHAPKEASSEELVRFFLRHVQESAGK